MPRPATAPRLHSAATADLDWRWARVLASLRERVAPAEFSRAFEDTRAVSYEPLTGTLVVRAQPAQLPAFRGRYSEVLHDAAAELFGDGLEPIILFEGDDGILRETAYRPTPATQPPLDEAWLADIQSADSRASALPTVA